MRHPAIPSGLRMCGGMGQFKTHTKATRPRGVKALLGSMLAGVMIAASTMTAVAATDTLPQGNVESFIATAADGTITTSGWAFDRDASGPINIHMYVDGVSKAFLANLSRPDVKRAYSLSYDTVGFVATMPANPGSHSVSVYAINNTGTGPNVLLQTKTVYVTVAPNVTCSTKLSFLNTGRNQSTGGTLSSGTEPVWEVANWQQATSGNPITIPPGAAATYGDPSKIPESKWEPAVVGNLAAWAWASSPYNNANWIGKSSPIDGSYAFYRMHFTIDQDVALSNLKIPISGASDDSMQGVYVNGVSVPFTLHYFDNIGPIATLTGPWRVGANEIVISVWNINPPSGLLISSPNDLVTCQVKNPAISLTMRDSNTVPTNTFRPGETTTLSGTVTNTGNVDLSDISMSSGLTAAKYADGETFNFTCPATTLAVGASMDCTARFTPDATGYANDGYVIMYPTASGTGAALGGKTQRVGSATNYTLYRRFILTYDANNPAATVVGGPTFASCGSVYGCNGKWGTLATVTSSTEKVFSGWYTARTGGTRITYASVASGDLTVYAHWLDPSMTVVTKADATTPANTYAQGVASTFTTTITNTGNGTLSFTPTPSDDNGGATPTITGCQTKTLAPGKSTTCTTTYVPVADDMTLDALTVTISISGVTISTEDAGVIRAVSGSASATITPRYTMTFNPVMPGAKVATNSITVKRGEQWGGLPAWTAPGGTAPTAAFDGWYTAASGGTRITYDTIAISDLTVYAHYHSTAVTVTFHPNAQTGTVTGTMSAYKFYPGCTAYTLPKNTFVKTTGAAALVDEANGEQGELYSTFMGWSRDPDARTAGIADGANACELSAGGNVDLYAVWDDAPQFVHDPFPNRFFTLAQAQAGDITQTALLSTVSATDRETNPLETKTGEQATASGDVGITLYDYDDSDYTTLTDSAQITLTYKVKDAAGHVAYLRITVTVSNTEPLPVNQQTHYRAISPTTANAIAALGGLADTSPWRTDTAHTDALTQALYPDAPTCYTVNAQGLRAHVLGDSSDGSGNFGNSTDPNALQQAFQLLQQTPCKP